MPQPIRLKDHEKDARLVKRRVLVGGVVIILLTCVLIMRMYYLQVIQYEHHSTLAENNRIHVQPLPPTRGLIYDRNGVIIADNRPSFSLTVTRERAGDWLSVLDTVVEVLDAPEADLFDGIIFDTTANRPGGHKFVDAPEVEGIYENGVVLTLDAAAAAKLAKPGKNPGSIEVSPDDVAGEPGPSFWRRAWNLLSGKG